MSAAPASDPPPPDYFAATGQAVPPPEPETEQLLEKITISPASAPVAAGGGVDQAPAGDDNKGVLATRPELEAYFSPGFLRQYLADHASPKHALEEFIVPGTERTDSLACVCLPDKYDWGICYVLRLIFSTFFHVMFYALLAAVLALYFTSTDYLTIELLCHMMIIAYVPLWLEMLCAYDLRYLCRIKTAEQLTEHMASVHQAAPILEFRVECYHYTDATDSKRGKKGEDRKRRSTHSDQRRFNFRASRDLAPPNINVEGAKATRINFRRTFTFADDRTRQSFEKQSAAIRDENRHRDHHMDYYETLELPGFRRRLLAYLGPGSAPPPCYHPAVYLLLSTLTCTWPFRWWFRHATAKTTYTFTKELAV